uniref:Disease resistance protein At4g27190-like leucine-rich repeats domain-containing protein n=1 Tax=Oryza punctata TaxID=4537 RepID=A0A0E0KQT1_ORYPU
MQRAIAVELKLDASVIEMIDNADEEDDFKGVDESSRSEITSVAEVIDQVIKDHISMIVFHNGSGDYIDLGSFGLAPFRRYFMLWTFRKRFQGSEHYSEIEDKVKNTHFFAYETQYDITRGDILFPVLQKEATAIAANYPCMRVIDPDRITHCCLYGLFLYLCLPKHLENEWAARASIYWMCDGIIQGDQAWEISTALSKEIKWDLQPSLQDEVAWDWKVYSCVEYPISLDLSGTAIRILDFTTMVVRVSGLKRLFLLGCEQLCIIKWGKNGTNVTRDLELLCIDTRPKIKYPQLFVDKNKSLGRLSVHAVIVDTRIARSLWALIDERSSDVDMNIHVTSSTVYGEVQSEGTYKGSISQLSDHVNMQQQDLTSAGQYHDVLLSMVGDAPMQSFPLPPTTVLSRHFEIAQGSHNLESELDINSPIRTLAHLVSEKAQSLHVHDISTSTCMPGGRWWWIRWCRIERCPKIETVFPKEAWDFDRLETAWVSDLLMARCIWSKGPRGYGASFQNLQHLHLRSCPRLQFVLPVWLDSFPNLKTLHVIHCSNLHNIFVLDEDYPWEITTKIGVAFPKLTTIHLHDLPMLRQICDVEFKMVAPALETIKIRGCWGLRRLPTVAADGPKPAVEIEKDVWDALEWDGVEANHHPSLFQAPVHSRYYKKKLPRGSVLCKLVV